MTPWQGAIVAAALLLGLRVVSKPQIVAYPHHAQAVADGQRERVLSTATEGAARLPYVSRMAKVFERVEKAEGHIARA